ncbi:MAG: MATE family efflux transporter [Oculatellaceae cyanobacterium Prado106]|nr:MATE family efflux transporter [Oculatellaceae cyanobacterium Prado106]
MNLRTFFKLALVNIFSNLLVPLAGLLDVAFLGHLADIKHLAGVSLATVLFNYIYWTFGFLRMGTTGMTAQAVGRGDRTTINLIALRHGLVALVIGLGILLLQQPLRAIGFTLLSATPEVKEAGRAFYNAMIWGAPATLLNFVLLGWFLGRGQSGKVLLLSLVNNVTSIGLDYLFVVRWHWQSTGAGAATAASQYFMLLAGVLFVLAEQWRSKEIGTWGDGEARNRGDDDLPVTHPPIHSSTHPPIRLSTHSLIKQILDPTALQSMFQLNREIVIRTFVLVSTFSLFTNLSSTMGAVTLTTNAVLLQVVTASAYFIDGFAFATESFAGMLQGRGATQDLLQLVKVSGICSFVLGMGIAIAFNLFPMPLFGLLTNHQVILDRIPQYVLWLFPVLGFGSIAYMLDGYFLGLTQGKILRQSSLVATLIGFLPGAIVAGYLNSSQLLWFALTLFMAARVVTLASQVRKTLARPIES